MRVVGGWRADGAAVGLGLAAGLLAALVTAAGTRSALIAAGVLVGGFALAAASVRPDLVLCLAILAIPLQASFVSAGATTGNAYATTSFGLTPPEVLFALSGYGWALGRVLRRRPPLAFHPLVPPLLLLTVAILPGFLVARDPFAVLKVLVNWVGFLMLFQMIAAEADERLLRRIFVCLAVAGAVVGVMAITGTNVGAQSYNAVTNTTTARASGPFAHPAQLSMFLLLTIPAAVALALRGAVALRVPAGAAAVVAVLGIALALSRSAFVGLAAEAAVLLAWAPFRRLALVVVAFAVVVSLAGLGPLGHVVNGHALSARIASTRAAVEGADPRIKVYRETPHMIADHPLFGVGANNFILNAGDYGMYDPSVGSAPDHAHDIALNITAEEGLFGLAALAWFGVVLFRRLARLTRVARGWARTYTMATVSALFAVTVYGLTDYPLIVNVLAAVIYTWAACAAALDRLVAEDG